MVVAGVRYCILPWFQCRKMQNQVDYCFAWLTKMGQTSSFSSAVWLTIGTRGVKCFEFVEVVSCSFMATPANRVATALSS